MARSSDDGGRTRKPPAWMNNTRAKVVPKAMPRSESGLPSQYQPAGYAGGRNAVSRVMNAVNNQPGRVAPIIANVARQGANIFDQALNLFRNSNMYNQVPNWLGNKTTPEQRQQDVVNAAKTALAWTTRNANNPAAIAQRYTTPTPEDAYRMSLPSYAKGPNWTRSEYIEPPNFWNENPGLRMLPDEYIKRRGAFERTNGVSPTFWQSEQERILRQNAAPAGTIYTPFSWWLQKPTLPSVGAGQQNTPSGPTNWGGGGGYEDWGYGGGGGGYGGGGYTYQDALAQFYNNMVSWTINQPNRGG